VASTSVRRGRRNTSWPVPQIFVSGRPFSLVWPYAAHAAFAKISPGEFHPGT